MESQQSWLHLSWWVVVGSDEMVMGDGGEEGHGMDDDDVFGMWWEVDGDFISDKLSLD